MSKPPRDEIVTTELRNPFYQLPSMATTLHTMDREAIFTPKIIDINSVGLTNKAKDLEEMELFKNSIYNGEAEVAWKMLQYIYEDKYTLFEAILEAAMEHINSAALDIVNTAFRYVYKILLKGQQVEPEEIVSLVALLLDAPKSDAYDTFLQADAAKVTKDTGVKKVQDGRVTLKDNIKKVRDVTIKHYDVLYICSNRYWTYPNFLSQLKGNKYHKLIRTTRELPKTLTPRQDRVARELSVL